MQVNPTCAYMAGLQRLVDNAVVQRVVVGVVHAVAAHQGVARGLILLHQRCKQASKQPVT